MARSKLWCVTGANFEQVAEAFNADTMSFAQVRITTESQSHLPMTLDSDATLL